MTVAPGTWLQAVTILRRERQPGVLVTVAAVRGHAPREPGAKMVVSAEGTWDSIGGGNLEVTAVETARRMLADHRQGPELTTSSLTEHAATRHGIQCCGGEVTLLLEPLAVVPAVAVFGLGHVGTELARILSRHDLDLHLVDSRAAQVEPGRLAQLAGARATLHAHHSPVPELVIGELPAGAHVLVMTHDHAEDLALVDVALRSRQLGSIGLIGSSAKWRRFERRLREEGHDDAAIARVHTPIGGGLLPGKDPATIALGVAVELLTILTPAAAHHEGVR
ncbi:MAG: xanthine dehydrogenase accessory protein XdhC [Actinomycetota bacterium]|nr:xanthine dehydrogenase accessory protein XdhC [Actinomycetota bacterium]